jgi:hypothetical protein
MMCMGVVVEVPLRTEKLDPFRISFDLQICEMRLVSMKDKPFLAVSMSVIGLV